MAARAGGPVRRVPTRASITRRQGGRADRPRAAYLRLVCVATLARIRLRCPADRPGPATLARSARLLRSPRTPGSVRPGPVQPYWAVRRPGCVAPDGDFTRLTVPRAGGSDRFSLRRRDRSGALSEPEARTARMRQPWGVFRSFEARLSRGRRDLIRQSSCSAGYAALRDRPGPGRRQVRQAVGNATRIIDLERTLHVFVEPSIQAWASTSTG